MAYDGSVRIDTELDTKGFEQALAKLPSLAEGAASAMVRSAEKEASGFRTVGEAMVAGLRAGVVAGQAALTASVRAVAQAATKAAKAALEIHSPSAIFRDEVGAPMMEGWALGIGENAELVSKALDQSLDAVKDWVSEKKKYDELALADEVRIWQAMRGLYAEGTAERAEIDLNYYESRKKLTQEMESLEEDYQEALARRTSELANFAGLFDEIQKKSVSGADVTTALESQVDTLRQWSEDMGLLGERGLGEGLLAELRELGPKAAAEIHAISGMTDEELRTYAELWSERQRLANEQALEELAGLRLQTDEQIALLLAGMDEGLQAYVLSAPELGSAVIEGMIEGLLSRESALTATARQVAFAAYEAAREALDIHSPSKKFMEIGAYSAEGMAEGFANSIGAVYKNIRAAISREQNLLAPAYAAAAGYQASAGAMATAGAALRTQNTVYETRIVKEQRNVNVGIDPDMSRFARELRPYLTAEEKRIGLTSSSH